MTPTILRRCSQNGPTILLITVIALVVPKLTTAHELPFGQPSIVLYPQYDSGDLTTSSVPAATALAEASTGKTQSQPLPRRRPTRDPAPEVIENANLRVPGVDNVTLRGTVVDAESNQPIACRIHVENADGVYYAPQGHRAIAPPARNNAGVEYEPDVTNRGKIWASLEDGSFSADLPAVDGYRVEIVRGLEYERPILTLDLAGQTGELEKTFSLKRGINMRQEGWMSADTHIHNLMPEAAFRQMKAEALDYVNLMFIGAGHPLYRGGYVTGKPTIVKDGHIVYVSQEIRDAQQGHMTLLGISKPIQPIRGYTGKELPTQTYVPHEPLNWEAFDRLHEQGGLAFHAHYLYWPGYGSAVSAALDKLDGVEWLTPDIVQRGSRTRQNIEVPGHPLTGAGPMWYYMLNSGCRLPVIGGTDKMSAGRVVGGGNRTYARVRSWDHQGFLDGLARGETFTSNGPLLRLSANGCPIGSEIAFDGKGPFTVIVAAGCFTQKPITYFQIVQNGQVVYEQPVEQDSKTVEIRKELTFSASGWLAVRCGNRRSDRNNWENAFTAAHSSPVYVNVNGRLPADKPSAEYMIARVKTSLQWAEKTAMFSTGEYRRRAVESFQMALHFYEDALQRATE